MSENYYLKIGGTEILNAAILAYESSDDTNKAKKATSLLADCLKEARVRIGTLLKTDNVSFLIGAGASMAAGGIGLATIPPALEKALVDNSDNKGGHEDRLWIDLFYHSASALTGQPFTLEERRPLLQEI